MAHYADGTPYEYDDQLGERLLLNVGWLEQGQPFPVASPSPELVDVLLRCALRPVELYRGFHTCDLCAQPPDGLATMHAFGRPIELGNGEIRVTRDGVTYAAPTLVVHYVAAHAYAPPPPFVHGVRAHAMTIPVASAAVIAAVEALDANGRRARAWRVAERAASALGDGEATAALAAAREGRPKRYPGPFGELLSDLRMLEYEHERPGRHAHDARQRGRVLEIIERAQELGVRDD